MNNISAVNPRMLEVKIISMDKKMETSLWAGFGARLGMPLPSVLALAFLVVFTSTNEAKAGIVNGGFESGDLSGWTITSSCAYWDCTGHLDFGITAGGGYFASPAEGSYFLNMNNGVTWPTQQVSQTVSLAQGETLSGYAGVSGKDPYVIIQPLATISISSDPVLWSKSGNPSAFAWEPWSWTAPVNGNYTLNLTLYDEAGSGWVNAYFDGIKTSPVPIPAAIWLFGSALAGLVGLGRRKSF
ncbi:MAG: VPLPA-CTERM sorting domain-containing protein [Methylococcaceae bacterium]